MFEANSKKYYGILLQVVEVVYTQGMPVTVFKCRWFNEAIIRTDREMESVDTSTNVYQENPWCLTKMVKQVFYVDDPMHGGDWIIVSHMFHRGIYNPTSLARNANEGPIYEIKAPCQEEATTDIPLLINGGLCVDFGPI